MGLRWAAWDRSVLGMQRGCDGALETVLKRRTVLHNGRTGTHSAEGKAYFSAWECAVQAIWLAMGCVMCTQSLQIQSHSGSGLYLDC